MVLKFLGIGKKSGYFLEAPPADAKADAKPAAKAPEPSHVDAAPAAKAPAPAPEPTEKKVKKTLKEANAEKKAKAEAKSGKTETQKVEPTPAPAPVPVVKAEPVLTNFATTLQMTNTPRRRPGPSMNAFKDMAKQVNPRK
jgi:hypothetical protein